MPIIFNELETILLNWKESTDKISSQGKSRISRIVTDSINSRQQIIYIQKIKHLFDSISINDLRVSESVNSDRTYGKLVVEKTVEIRKSSNL